MCNNVIAFSGKKENVIAFKKEIEELNNQYEKTELGVYVEGYEKGKMIPLFFDNGLHNIDENVFGFETKWAPSIDMIKFLCLKHKVDLDYFYQEDGSYIYGVLTYDFISKNFTETNLEKSDFDKISEDPKKNYYIFENEKWESKDEILELILDRKIKNYEKQD